MKRKILTLENLIQFCKENNFNHFDSSENDYRICVQVPAKFDVSESDDKTLLADVLVMHTSRNRNGSNLTEVAAEECMETMAYKPVLANFCEIDGVRDFTSHDMEINDDGTINYLERQVGCFTADEPYMQDDEKVKGRKNIFGRVAIPREYTDAAEIIERKNGTKVSVELEIKKMSYDAKEKELIIESAEILGLTLLGRNPESGAFVEEGMQGAHIQLEDFSFNDKPSVDEKLVEIVKATILEAFDNIQNSEKGGKTVKKQFDEAENPEVLDEEVTAEEKAEETVETPSEEEVTEETPAEDEKAEEGEEEAPEADEETPAEEDAEEPAEEEKPVADSIADLMKATVTIGNSVREFSLSMDEKFTALCELVNDTYGGSDNDYYGLSVYDEDGYLIMVGWWSGKAYKQSFSREGDTFSLVGERVEVFAEWLTAEEQTKLADMRSNYDAIAEKLAKYEAEPEKIAILNSEDYANLEGDEAFEALKEQANHFDLSVDEIKTKLDEMLLEYAKGHKVEFSQKPAQVGMKRIVPMMPNNSKGKGKYGGVFSRKK